MSRTAKPHVYVQRFGNHPNAPRILVRAHSQRQADRYIRQTFVTTERATDNDIYFAGQRGDPLHDATGGGDDLLGLGEPDMFTDAPPQVER